MAIAESGRQPARYWGTMANTLEAVSQWLRQLGPAPRLPICYEAAPTG